MNKIETMIRGLQGGGLASDARNKLPVAPSKAAESPPRDSWDATSESLLVLPEPVQAVRESVIEEIRQPYRTYVDTSTPKQLFLGRDYNASMEDTMLQEAIKEKRHWLQCLDTYTNMEPVGTEYNESRMILSETAVVWIKVN